LMPEAGSVTIKLSIRNRPRVSCCQSVTQPKTTLESCWGHDTRLDVVKNHSFPRFGTFNPPITLEQAADRRRSGRPKKNLSCVTSVIDGAESALLRCVPQVTPMIEPKYVTLNDLFGN